MRKARFTQSGGVYHVNSRVIEKAFIFDDTEKERMRVLLFQLAAFSGVRVLTHAFMSNHFHLVLEVPERPSDSVLDEAELIRRLAFLPKAPTAPYTPAEAFRRELEKCRKSANAAGVKALCDAVRERLFDLSRFVREYKQRISQDYNRRHERKGTLWEERFHSTLIERDAHSLLHVAGYVDLNPLRAGLCADPKDYRFCGYAAAIAGHAGSMEGLARLFALAGMWGEARTEQALAAYRVLLFGEAAEKPWKKKENRVCLTEEEISRVRDVGGQVPLVDKLKCRIRFISDGVALGSQIFIQNLCCRYQERNRLKNAPGGVSVESGVGEGWWALNPVR